MAIFDSRKYCQHISFQVAPYLQGVHFFYGFGAFLSPLLARPFLRKACSYVINTITYYTGE